MGSLLSGPAWRSGVRLDRAEKLKKFHTPSNDSSLCRNKRAPPTAMFAVPGWAVSASSLVQDQARAKKPISAKYDTTTEKHSKKRKRIAEATSRKHEENTATQFSALIPKSPRLSHPNPTEELPKELRNAWHAGNPGSRKESDGATSKYELRQQKSRAGERKNKSQKYSAEVDINPYEVDRGPPREFQSQSSSINLTPLQAKMRSKLTSARFRHLNETLYTTNSSEALNLFTSSPDLFADYHAGFAQQVRDSWPQNPVDTYIRTIKSRGAQSESKPGALPLPRRKTGSCTIADLGCGDAPLARGCQSVARSLQLKFHNYDLHAPNSLVTKADISNLPLRDGEADIVVFCLSLMGTNWIDFVEEAWRVLRGDGKGEVWVAEVKSRFGRVTRGHVVENSVGKKRKNQKPKPYGEDDEYDGPEHFATDERSPPEDDDETDISAFIKVFTRRGFQLREGSVNKRNKMFVSMTFTKSGIPTAGKHKGLKWTGKEYQKQINVKTRFVGGQKEDGDVSPEQEAKVLKPCVYKTR